MKILSKMWSVWKQRSGDSCKSLTVLLSSNSRTATIQLSAGSYGGDNRREREEDERKCGWRKKKKSEKEAADKTRDKKRT